MTLALNVIFGDRSSICRNDAYAVVEQQGRKEKLLTIIPASDTNGADPGQILDAFARARAWTRSDDFSVLRSSTIAELKNAPARRRCGP